MRIVHVITSTNLGGAQVMLQRYLAALGRKAVEHAVISLLPDGPLAAAMASTGARVMSVGLEPGRLTPGGILRLRRYLREEAPDVVHGWMYHGCLAAWLGLTGLGRRKRPALVWAIHHSLQNMANEKPSTRVVLRVMARLSRRADLIAYCSAAARAQHEAIGFDGAAATLIPNGVNAEVFHPDPDAGRRLRALCGLPPERLIVGNVARSHPMKSHEILVRCIAHLLDWGHDVQAVIIGEGHVDGPAAREARALGIADRLSTLGARDDVAELLPGFDVFLLTSTWGEAFPLAVAEAMAAGIPCVVTDVGDCAMMVGDTGIVVSPTDSGAQAQAVVEVIAGGSTKQAEMGRRARERVVELYSMERYVSRNESAYADALERHRLGEERRLE